MRSLADRRQAEAAVATGRVAKMIEYLLENQQEIDGLERGEVTFSFAGRNIKPQIRKIDKDIKVAGSYVSRPLEMTDATSCEKAM